MSVNEASSCPVVLSIGRLHNTGSPREATAKSGFASHRRVGLSCAQALAGPFAALITVTGCVTTGGGAGGNVAGGPSSLAAVQSARTSQNIVARDQAIQLQNQQRQQILEARRIERREAVLEAARQRQIAADRLVLQQEQEKARQQAQQRAQQSNQGNAFGQGQGNQGQGQGPKNIPPGQAKKQ
jgi:hypothetical protein